MTRTYRKWTEAESQTARRLRASGLSYAKIGAAVGRATSSVENFLRSDTGIDYRLGRVCSDCPSKIIDINKSGRCKRCLLRSKNSDAQFQEKRLTALRASPLLQAGSPIRSEAARKASITRMSNPEYVEYLREFMRTVAGPRGLAAIAKLDRTEIGKRQSERLMAWCPPEYRDAYRFLIRSKGLRKWEAQQVIRAQIKADDARLSPFERQERALAKGAALAANDAAPSRYAAEKKWNVG